MEEKGSKRNLRKSAEKLKDFTVPEPTSDGGIEHTAARFLPPSQWLSMQLEGKIILPPPQVYLLSLIDPFLSPSTDVRILEDQRRRLTEFVGSGDEDMPFSRMCISPVMIHKQKSDGRSVLALHNPGYELRDTDRKGDSRRVVLVRFESKGVPQSVEVRWKREVLAGERERDEQQKSREKL